MANRIWLRSKFKYFYGKEGSKLGEKIICFAIIPLGLFTFATSRAQALESPTSSLEQASSQGNLNASLMPNDHHMENHSALSYALEPFDSRRQVLGSGIDINDSFFVNLGSDRFRRGDIQGAISSYLVALTMNPGRLEIYLDLSRIYLRLENYPLALDLLERASDIHGFSPSIELMKVVILISAREFEMARISLYQVMEIEPENSVVYMYLGDLHWLEGDLELAFKHYEEAKRMDGLSKELAIRLGKLWMRQQNDLMAIVYFRYWLEESPADPEAHYYLGLALSQRGRYDEAHYVFGEAADLYLYAGNLEAAETARIAQESLDLMNSK